MVAGGSGGGGRRYSWAAGISGVLLRQRPGRGFGAINGGQDFGNDSVEVRGNALSHFDRAIEGVRQRRILDHRNVLPAGDFPDLGGEQVASLGDHDGRRHVGTVFERDGVCGGIGDDDGGALGVLQHSAAAHLALQAADAAFDDGIAFRFLVFVFQFLAAHFQFARKMLALEQVVENGPDEENERRFPGDFEDASGGKADHAAGGTGGERHQHRPVAAQTADADIGDGGGGKQRLDQSAQCGDGEKLSYLGGGTHAGTVGQERCGSEDQSSLRQGGGECHGPSQARERRPWPEQPGVGEEGSSASMRRLPETAPSRQSRKKPRQARGKFDIREKRTKMAAMPEAAPIRSRLRATCPFSRAFSRRRGVACSVWLDCGIGQLSVASSSHQIVATASSMVLERARL